MAKTRSNERGSTLLLFTVAMVGMMGMAALAIDLGFLRKARAEAQRAADAAALAGASAFQLDVLAAAKVDSANVRANRVAAANYMNGVAFDPLTEVTVTVIPDSVKVRVKARRAAVPTWFARVFGLNSLPVGAVAAAEASNASGASCVKPLAIPDWWADGDNDNVIANRIPDPGENWLWNPANDTYHPAHWDSDSNGFPNDGAGTGLGSEWRNLLAPPGERDWGRQVVLRPPVAGEGMQVCTGSFGGLQGGKCYVPSWWGYWGPNPVANSFNDCGLDAQLGVNVPTTTGFIANVGQAIDAIIGQDGGASWSPTAIDSVTGMTGTVIGSNSYGKWRSSPRVWTVAMVAPGDMPSGPGGSVGQTVFNNFMSFFVEGCIRSDGSSTAWEVCGPPNPPGKALVGRFVGRAKGTSVGPAPGTMVRILRLVE